MALHVYQTWIEYDSREGYSPVNVYVKRGTGNQAEQIAEFHGKTLAIQLNKARLAILAMENEEMDYNQAKAALETLAEQTSDPKISEGL